MRLKIRCDGESEKFCKIFWELNKALVFHFQVAKEFWVQKLTYLFNLLQIVL
jgi:hypothetical protein